LSHHRNGFEPRWLRDASALPLVAFRENPMNGIPIQNVAFDDTTTLALGKAFDKACNSLRNFGSVPAVREIIAKRIISAATNGERDPARLQEQALLSLGSEDTSMLIVSVGSDLPVPAYALVTHAA
jgi:hypothetical protein